ncbi:unnamed protein product [Durusdinium trenchii]|uniref:Uncharacterized protein n=1 Tax=Durusdinium trenchii TaxID=1381693 RepID=A0ABP0HAM1_9DINO
MEPELNQADRFYTVVSPTFAAAIAEKSLPEFAARRILSYRVSMIERLFAKDHGWRWEEANMGTVVCVAILLGGSARTGRVIWNMFPSSIRVR